MQKLPGSDDLLAFGRRKRIEENHNQVILIYTFDKLVFPMYVLK